MQEKANIHRPTLVPMRKPKGSINVPACTNVPPATPSQANWSSKAPKRIHTRPTLPNRPLVDYSDLPNVSPSTTDKEQAASKSEPHRLQRPLVK